MIVGSLVLAITVVQLVYFIIAIPLSLVLLMVLERDDVVQRMCPTVELWGQIYRQAMHPNESSVELPAAGDVEEGQPVPSA
jgi:hypothetical protein